MHWQPAASLSNIRARAALYAQIRAFFAQRNVLEVETPILNASTASEPQLRSLQTIVHREEGGAGSPFYLHTSPEYPMKRLLAAGSGAIYQICKTFRDGERGRRHNPEFTMLEWYRPDFTLQRLIEEVAQLVNTVLGTASYRVISYRQAFVDALGTDPFRATERSLNALAEHYAHYEGEQLDRDAALDVLMACVIEPRLGASQPEFLVDYPPSQASLARVVKDDQGDQVAARFELYIDGLELANGYWELCDAAEQRRRFEADNHQRKALGFEEIPLDEHLLAALNEGFPDCSGVALGLDRLLMIQQGAQSIDEVLCFPVERV